VHVFYAFSIWWTYNCPVASRLDNNSSRFAALRKIKSLPIDQIVLLAARSSAEAQRGDYISVVDVLTVLVALLFVLPHSQLRPCFVEKF